MKRLFIIITFVLISFFQLSATGNPITVSKSATICKGDSILLGGSYQKTSGTYYDSLKTTMNVDSIITTTLNVAPTYFIPKTARVCGYDSTLINGNYIKTAGVYYDSLKSSLGCDSIIEVTVIDSSIKVGKLGRFGPSGIQSNVSGNKYVWLDCDNNYSVIDGITQQTALNLKNGRFAVEVTRNGCIDTSECLSLNVGINELSFSNSISLYPIPAKNNVNIEFGRINKTTSIKVLTIEGKQLVFETQMSKSTFTLNTSQLVEGIYLLKINADGKQAIKRFVIE
jgi:hypothetical protein